MEVSVGNYCSFQKQDLFYKKGVLKNFAKFTEKHLCQGLFFNKVASLLLKNTSGGCFCQFNFYKAFQVWISTAL